MLCIQSSFWQSLTVLGKERNKVQLKPIKTRKIYEEIVEQIRKLVTEGKLKAGDKLPSERELAERLQVSRASVREALSALAMMGLLDVRSGEGTFMREVNLESFVAPLAWVLLKEKNTVVHLLEVRKILEVQAVELAAERADDNDLAELAEAFAIMQKETEANLLGDMADHRFHYAIAKATHNPILIRMIDTISDTMLNSLHAMREALFQGDTPKRLLREHSGIYEAIKRRDPVAARQGMIEHLVGVEQEMLAKNL